MTNNAYLPVSYYIEGKTILIYFDSQIIDLCQWIESVFLIFAIDRNYYSDSIKLSLNHDMTHKNFAKLNTCQDVKTIFSNKFNKCCKFDIENVDITEVFIKMALGEIENHGLLLNMDACFHGICTLLIKYYDRKTSLDLSDFMRKKHIVLFSLECMVHSPWILMQTIQGITFHIKNLSSNEIYVHLENSPDTQDYTKDPQILSIPAYRTELITPYYYSRYIRITAYSNIKQPVILKLWIQINTYNNLCGQ